MIEDQRPGTIYWIDHYVVGTNDVDRWEDCHTKILGGRTFRESQGRREFGIFQDLTNCHHGGFVQKEPLPRSRGVGKSLPRHGFFIRPDDVDDHLRRLDAHQVPHGDPIRTSAEGEEGTAIYWEDPDGNQFEFWAPNRLPDGAMGPSEAGGPLRIGRISHGVYESRDLQRTASFFNRYCMLEPLSSADIPPDTLVLPLAGGGRIVFNQVETLGHRTGGRGVYRGLHAALVVRDEDFFPNYERMWAELPEWDYDERQGRFTGDAEALPARTVLHGSPAGRKWKAFYGRGDDWFDYDTNCFHFFGGAARGPSMALYEPHSMDYHSIRYMEAHGKQ